ncbi:hypothetical protein GCM10027614_14090 [Micromonospora vulcania]
MPRPPVRRAARRPSWGTFPVRLAEQEPAAGPDHVGESRQGGTRAAEGVARTDAEDPVGRFVPGRDLAHHERDVPVE